MDTVHYETKSIVKEIHKFAIKTNNSHGTQPQRFILNKYYVLYIYIFTFHFNNTQNKHFQMKVTNVQQIHYFVLFQIREFNKLSVLSF